MMSEIRKSTTKMKNNTLAMAAAPAAKPVNPKTAAITAMMKNTRAQRSIVFKFDDEGIKNVPTNNRICF
jgi:hypothetical protein